MKTIPPPPGVEIAALRKKAAQVHHLMQPGSGTPWEDRGSNGAVRSFIATARLALVSPLSLLRAIHRPETATDARALVLVCGLMWSVSLWVHAAGWFLYQRGPVSGGFWIITLALSLLAPIITLLVLHGFSIIYYKLLMQEIEAHAPPVLMFNVLAYCLPVSMLAPLPVIGPVLALGWFMVLAIVAGVKRLYVSVRGALIGVLLTTMIWAAIAVAGYFLLPFVVVPLWHAIVSE